MTQSLPAGLSNCLLWSPENGMGYHTAPPMSYQRGYWESYRARDATPMGAALTAVRVDFVRRHYTGPLVDIGIGGGRFVREMGCQGYDVCIDAVAWLRDQGRYSDPYATSPNAIACWDSLEHIQEPEQLVSRVAGWVFVSMPIYGDVDDVLTSKHYKPSEHLWYWTDAGLVAWFERLGFALVADDDFETQLGREGINSYAFRRVAAGDA